MFAILVIFSFVRLKQDIIIIYSMYGEKLIWEQQNGKDVFEELLYTMMTIKVLVGSVSGNQRSVWEPSS